MQTSGWVKLHRKILENVELMNDPTARGVFYDLLLLSNSKGEVAESGRALAEKLCIKHSTLYKALKRLEGYTIIKQSSKHRYTLIYICNWSKYQSTGKHFGKHTVNTGETHGKQTTGVPRIENKELRKPVIVSENSPGYIAFKEKRERLGL